MHALKLRHALLVLLAAAVVIGSWWVPADRAAREQVTGGLTRALTVFAAARALGAVISVAQGTQLDVKPVGVGVSFAPGQALQPLNEFIDQFATVMLVASVSFGIQLLLLEIGTHWVVSALLSAAVAGAVLLSWRGANTARWLRPALIMLLVLRFAVPMAALANGALHKVFMEDGYRAELASIERSPAAVLGRAGAPAANGEGLAARLRQWVPDLDAMRAAYDSIQKAAADWSLTIVKLISLFILQTLLLPVIFLWLAWRFARALASRLMAPIAAA
ncbi:hypothetical protein [Variovorax saccharolyticus]|uniref:hypothetical protein n=1 Tax=Variovorax saccharolyticus TaxID=3053516 RepID=UPI0025783C7C|nr:hypothetical protein [Variovorax sp. J31P216]MDM0028544.1 hypothetical protein [Variovorax sp. J31P216]